MFTTPRCKLTMRRCKLFLGDVSMQRAVVNIQWVVAFLQRAVVIVHWVVASLQRVVVNIHWGIASLQWGVVNLHQVNVNLQRLVVNLHRAVALLQRGIVNMQRGVVCAHRLVVGVHHGKAFLLCPEQRELREKTCSQCVIPLDIQHKATRQRPNNEIHQAKVSSHGHQARRLQGKYQL